MTTPSINDVVAEPRKYLAAKAHFLVLGYTLTLLVCNLSAGRALTYHEVVFAQPAREMLATGDWLVPRISGVPFTDKPPLTAWSIAFCLWLMDNNAEWVVRLPSVLAGLLTSWMVAWTGARWFGTRVGMIAGMMQATFYYYLQMATLAEADMPLIAEVTVALCLFACYHIDSPQGRLRAWWLPPAFFLAAGISFLSKGPLGSFFIFSSTGLYLVLQKDWAGMRFFLNPLGLTLYALCVLTYPALAFSAYPPLLDAWIEHNLGRFQGDLGQGLAGDLSGLHHLYYFYHLPLVLLPWLPWILLGLWGQPKLWRQPFGKFLLCWLIPGLVLLCAATFKSKHYLSPLLPGFTIAGALGLTHYFQLRKRTLHLHTVGWIGLVLLIGIGGSVLVGTLRPPGTFGLITILLVATCGIIGLLLLEQLRQVQFPTVAFLALVWILVVVAYQQVMPSYDSYRAQADFARQINQSVPSDQLIYLVDMPRSQVTFYLQQNPVRVDDADYFLGQVLPSTDKTMHIVTTLEVAKRMEKQGVTKELIRCQKGRSGQSQAECPVLVRWQFQDQNAHFEKE